MGRATDDSKKRRDHSSDMARKQAKENKAYSQGIARARAQFCKTTFYGYDSNNVACRTSCIDSEDCIRTTEKRLLGAEKYLEKLIHGSDTEYDPRWSEVGTGSELLDLDELRKSVQDLAESFMAEVDSNPHRLQDIDNISDLNTKVLDATVPGWKEFRKQKPKLAPESVFSRLAEIWNENADRVREHVGNEEDIHAAWAEIVQHDYHGGTRKKTVTQLCKQLEAYIAQLEEAFPREFGKEKKSEKHWPAAWMKNDNNIRTMLNQYEHFASILNIMWKRRNILRPNTVEYQKLAEKTGCDAHKDSEGNMRDMALLPETLTYEVIARELGKSKQLVQKYMKAMHDIGVLEIYSQKGRNSFTVFAIGYFVEWQNKYRVVPFLQEKLYGKNGRLHQQLANFKVGYNAR